jgi:hypothetical protein
MEMIDALRSVGKEDLLLTIDQEDDEWEDLRDSFDISGGKPVDLPRTKDLFLHPLTYDAEEQHDFIVKENNRRDDGYPETDMSKLKFRNPFKVSKSYEYCIQFIKRDGPKLIFRCYYKSYV